MADGVSHQGELADNDKRTNQSTGQRDEDTHCYDLPVPGNFSLIGPRRDKSVDQIKIRDKRFSCLPVCTHFRR